MSNELVRHEATDDFTIEQERRVVRIGEMHDFGFDPIGIQFGGWTRGSGRLTPQHSGNDNNDLSGNRYQGGAHFSAEDANRFREQLVREGWLL